MTGNRVVRLGMLALALLIAVSIVFSACVQQGGPPSGGSAGTSGSSRSATASQSAAASAAASAAPSGPSSTPAPSAASATVLAVGDIAACEVDADEQTADIVAAEEGTVLTLGDHVYPDGSAEDFAECYDPAWGAFRDRTRPVIGNHEYQTDRGDPYFSYFGAAAGTRGDGWYSYDLGAWHIVALNSNCALVGCDEDSEQAEWLARDLVENPAECTLAYWHHPRYSSGPEGGHPEVADLWAIFDRAGGDVVVTGHAHIYERLVTLDWDGYDDPDGIRHFIVGTGGRSLYDFGDIEAASDVRSNDAFGVLKLSLNADTYDWEFLPVEEDGFTDSGSADCH